MGKKISSSPTLVHSHCGEEIRRDARDGKQGHTLMHPLFHLLKRRALDTKGKMVENIELGFMKAQADWGNLKGEAIYYFPKQLEVKERAIERLLVGKKMCWSGPWLN